MHEQRWPNMALHLTAIPLRSIAAGELGRYPPLTPKKSLQPDTLLVTLSL